MLVKTLLNNVEKYSSFIYKKTHLGVQNFNECLIIEIDHRVGSKGKCPKCLKRCATYDTSQEATFILLCSALGISRVFFISAQAGVL